MSQDGRSVLIALNGTEKHLRYNVNLLADLEQQMGQPLGTALSAEAIGIRTIRSLLWAGLKGDEPTLSVVGAGDLMQTYLDNGGSLTDLTTKMLEALHLAGFAGDKDKGEGKVTETGPFVSELGSTPQSP